MLTLPLSVIIPKRVKFFALLPDFVDCWLKKLHERAIIPVPNFVVATKDLKVAAKEVLNINVQNARSVGIKATCTHPYSSCPYVAFVEASLG